MHAWVFSMVHAIDTFGQKQSHNILQRLAIVDDTTPHNPLFSPLFIWILPSIIELKNSSVLHMTTLRIALFFFVIIVRILNPALDTGGFCWLLLFNFLIHKPKSVSDNVCSILQRSLALPACCSMSAWNCLLFYILIVTILTLQVLKTEYAVRGEIVTRAQVRILQRVYRSTAESVHQGFKQIWFDSLISS